jgi:NodT family efflux transporter outer membrane factor (OMF) lipoprotein
MKKAWLAVISLMGVGCSVGPKYTTPTTQVPAAFKEPLPGAFKEFKASEPKDDRLKGKWWEAFGDAQLNGLEEQVNISNQSVAQAEAQFREARAAIRAARSGLFPTVTAGPTVTEAHTSANSISSINGLTSTAGTGTTTTGSTTGSTTGTGGGVRGRTYTNLQIPIDFSYEIDAWGRIRHQVEASVATAQASAADLETAKLSAQALLATDYFELRGSDQKKRLLDDTVADYVRQLTLTVQRRDQGVATQLDVEQARTQLETARAQSMDLGVARAQFEHAIAVLTGKPPSALTLEFNPAAVEPPVIPVALPSELLERRADIAAAERRAAAQNAQIGIAEAAFYPQITLSASAGLASSSLLTLFSWPSRIWTVGPALAQTLFDAGNRRAVTQEAQATYDANAATYRQTVLSAFQGVEDNLAALRVLEDEARQENLAVESAERSLSLARERYVGGVDTYLDVITAEAVTLTNESTAVDILTRRMTASVALVQALGGGWDVTQIPAAKDLVAKKP